MKLNSSLFNIPLINNVLFFDTIDSTNIKAKELANRGSVHGSLVVGKKQTAGRGRMGRSFNSDSQDGLYFSLMLRPDIPQEKLSMLTLVTGLAVSKAIDSFCQVNTKIKWPNDITLNDKKLAGILLEAGPNYVVIGVGINVNTQSFHPSISDTATSIYKVTGKSYDKSLLLYHVLTELNFLYHSFTKYQDLSFYIPHNSEYITAKDEYNLRINSLNKEVYIIPIEFTLNSSNPAKFDTSTLNPMTCLGIDSNGNLLCKDIDDTIQYINSGEVSLRNL